MNQGIGPNWDTANATYDFGSFPQQIDSDPYANGDGNCHIYVATAGITNIGWYMANQDQTTNGYAAAYAVKLNVTATRHRAWVRQSP